jgi:hypothetical protein
MAGAATDGAMDTPKRERGMGVIEAVNVGPRPGAMASLTAELSTIRSSPFHAVFELSVMWIDVAGSACTIGKAERQNFIRPASQPDFVTLRASYRRVATGQREISFLMLRNGEGGAMKVGHGVAGFASVLVRGGGKLSVVGVLVTIQTGRKLDLIYGLLPGGDVTFAAFHLGVHALQGVLGGSVFLRAEQ